MKKKKILYFVEPFAGGIFTYLCNLSNSLCNEFDIYIAYGIRKTTPDNFQDYFDKKVHFIYVKNYQREISFKKDMAALKEMKKIVKDVKPDIVHLNSSKAGILGRWLFRNSKTPVFYTPHGYSFLMTNISKKKKLFYKSLEKFFAFKNIETIACSKSEYEITKELTSNATYVDNGINLEEFDGLKIDHQTNFDHLKVATLGRISLQKNPGMFNQIAEAFPNIDFIWIGDGDLKNKLTAPNIRVTGWVDNKTALNYLADIDLFILTSLWEGLPMALLEAMYMKKVCMVSNVIGNKDVICNNKNGYVCNEVRDFISDINLIITRKRIPLNIVNIAHNNVVEHYNSQVMVTKYERIYKDSITE